jgi:hypothetical protein
LSDEFDDVVVETCPSPVDATDVRHSLAPLGAASARAAGCVRSISLALHHLPPALAQAVVADAVRSNVTLVVSDLAPTGGGVLWNWMLGLRFASPREIWERRGAFPWVLYCMLPLAPVVVPFLGWHDATVSVLRSYSVRQMTELLHAVPGGASRSLTAYHSSSYGAWIGLPEQLWLPGMGHPVIQYLVIR